MPLVILALLAVLLVPAAHLARQAHAADPAPDPSAIPIYCDAQACVIPFALAKRLVDLWNRDASGKGGCRGTAVAA